MFKSLRDGYFALGLTIGASIAIFAIVWVIGLNYCPESPCNYDHKHAHGPTDGPTQHQGWIPRPDLPNFTLQTEPEFSEGNPTQYEYADLTAQENMARATNWIVWISLFSSVVAVAGVGLLISNLNVTRESSRDATRAYVHVKGIHIKNTFDEGMHWADCTFLVENSGATPCKRFEIDGGAIYGVPTTVFDKLPSLENTPVGWSALPGNETFIAPKQFVIQNPEAIEGNYVVHIGGVVKYWTFFGEEFETEFSFTVTSSYWDDANRVDGKRMKMSRSPFKIRSYEQIKYGQPTTHHSSPRGLGAFDT